MPQILIPLRPILGVLQRCSRHIESDKKIDASQFEPHVKAFKAKKAARNHDPLALVANSYANPSYSHASPSLFTTTILSITQHYSTPTNNRLRTSSSTRNQVVIQDGRVDIQIKIISYAGNGSRNVGRTNRTQATNAGNRVIQNIKENEENVQRIPRTSSTSGKTNVRCYNCNGKGHYARDCLKPRVRDAKYFKEQMLLSTKVEARFNLDAEENDFMLMNAYGDDHLEELNASVIMMAHI
ncbi:nucleotide-binding alpha-beta plait domain-containing protein [Tanacetum coccineum]